MLLYNSNIDPVGTETTPNRKILLQTITLTINVSYELQVIGITE